MLVPVWTEFGNCPPYKFIIVLFLLHLLLNELRSSHIHRPPPARRCSSCILILRKLSRRHRLITPVHGRDCPKQYHGSVDWQNASPPVESIIRIRSYLCHVAPQNYPKQRLNFNRFTHQPKWSHLIKIPSSCAHYIKLKTSRLMPKTSAVAFWVRGKGQPTIRKVSPERGWIRNRKGQQQKSNAWCPNLDPKEWPKIVPWNWGLAQVEAGHIAKLTGRVGC